MAFLGLLLILAGGIIATVYGVIIMIRAFQTSIVWGLAYIFIPFASLVYIVVYWQEVKKPFLYSLLGLPLMGLGIALAGVTNGG